MRLSTSMMYANGLKGVLSQETDMNRLVEQIGSGRKFLTPADDPLAAALSINVAQTQSMNATYQLNRNTAKTNLGQENNVLDSVTTALESVRTRVVQAGNGTMSDSDRQVLSTALKSAREALLGWPIAQTATVSTCSRVIRAVRRPTYRTRPARSCTAAPRANAPSRLTNRARCPPATWARISSAGRTPARRLRQLGLTRQYRHGPVRHGVHHAGWRQRRQELQRGIRSGSDDGRYWLSRHDDRSVRCHTACHQSGAAGVPTAYTDGAAIDFGGVSVVIKGKPQNGDIINVENIQSANVDVFNTLDNLIKTLDSPIAGDEKALAKLANDPATANKKLSTNYDNVLTVAASVARAHE